jgi:hypothetical protein
MKTPRPIKGFDAVAFKHEAALRIYEMIKDMTPRQELEFWKNARPIHPRATAKKHSTRAAR